MNMRKPIENETTEWKEKWKWDNSLKMRLLTKT